MLLSMFVFSLRYFVFVFRLSRFVFSVFGVLLLHLFIYFLHNYSSQTIFLFPKGKLSVVRSFVQQAYPYGNPNRAKSTHPVESCIGSTELFGTDKSWLNNVWSQGWSTTLIVPIPYQPPSRQSNVSALIPKRSAKRRSKKNIQSTNVMLSVSRYVVRLFDAQCHPEWKTYWGWVSRDCYQFQWQKQGIIRRPYTQIHPENKQLISNLVRNSGER